MKKKILYILTTAVLICTAFLVGRNTAPHTTKTVTKTIHTMPENELAVSTKDGYELYAQKQENVYAPKFKQFIGFNEFASWTIDGNILTITTSDGNTYTFNK